MPAPPSQPGVISAAGAGVAGLVGAADAAIGDAVGFSSVGASVVRRVPPNNCFGCRPVRARAGPQRFVAVRGAATMVTHSFTGTV